MVQMNILSVMETNIYITSFEQKATLVFQPQTKILPKDLNSCQNK